MRKIFKYAVAHNQLMPITAKVVRVGMQNGDPFLWAIVPDGSQKEIHNKRHFEIFGTGGDIPDNAAYVGGYQEPPFEWHVFEVFE